jgi:RNA polymerase sigma-70 factor (ECF subfamily)
VSPEEALTQARLESLYARLEKPMWNALHRLLWDAHEAQDALHEAFLKVWRARERVDARTAEPLLWRAALNVGRSRLRARRLWRWATLAPLREAPHGAPGPDAQLEGRAREAALRRAIASLPERLREVVLLCELGGLKYEEAAEVLRVPMGTVASRRHKAVALLRAALGEEEHDAAQAVR